MKLMLRVVATFVAACALTHAQTAPGGPAGTWQGDGVPVSVVLKATASTVTGTVAQGAAAGTEISDGMIEGNVITFKVQFPNGGRTVMFTGKLDGDSIAFTREVKVPEGAAGGGGGILGANGPSDFTVSRLMTASMWSGTIRNAPSARNPDPMPNPRPVNLGTKKVPAPHWLWRGGEKQLEVRTFTLPMGTFDLSLFQLEGDKLTFSYTRPGPGDEVTCKLARQPEGRFSGTCLLGGGNSQLIDLTPPDAQKPGAAAQN